MDIDLRVVQHLFIFSPELYVSYLYIYIDKSNLLNY
jgi:hypothetical protein